MIPPLRERLRTSSLKTESTPPPPRELAQLGRLTLPLAGLLTLASVAGIAWPTTYALEVPVVRPALVAQDVFNLAVAVPLLVLSWLRMRAGALRMALVWLGTLAYMVYAFAVYAFNVHHNPLFLVYVALFSLSTYGLVAGAFAVPRERLVDPTHPNTERWAGGFMVGVGLMFTLVWLLDIGISLASGRPPAITVRYQIPTFAPYVLDLGFALPALVVGGRRLMAHRAGGHLVGGFMLFMMTLMMLQLGTGTAYQGIVTHQMEWGFLYLFNGLALVSLAVTVAFLNRCIRPWRSTA